MQPIPHGDTAISKWQHHCNGFAPSNRKYGISLKSYDIWPFQQGPWRTLSPGIWEAPPENRAYKSTQAFWTTGNITKVEPGWYVHGMSKRGHDKAVNDIPAQLKYKYNELMHKEVILGRLILFLSPCPSFAQCVFSGLTSHLHFSARYLFGSRTSPMLTAMP